MCRPTLPRLCKEKLLKCFENAAEVHHLEVLRICQKLFALCSVCMSSVFCVSLPADLNGVDLNPVQDTPVATRKEDTYIHFSVDVEIQRHVEKLPKGNFKSDINRQAFKKYWETNLHIFGFGVFMGFLHSKKNIE